MKQLLVCLLVAIGLESTALSDFAGPNKADTAMSPNGRMIARITTSIDDNAQSPPNQHVSIYEYDETTDSFLNRSRFEFAGYLGEMLYLSNTGDLIFVSLGQKEAVRLFSRDGTLQKKWDLTELLTRQEIKACAETGSTLQWVEEGSFNGRILYLRGPSRTVRALGSPYTVMRHADPKTSFLLTIDASTSKVTKSR